MNRSYNKIRHIQESNLKLEQRLLLIKEADTQSYSATVAKLEQMVQQKCPKKDAVVKGCIDTLTSGPIKEFFYSLMKAGLGIWNFCSGIAGSIFSGGLSLLQAALGSGLIASAMNSFAQIDYSDLWDAIVKVYNCAKRKIEELIKVDPEFEECQN